MIGSRPDLARAPEPPRHTPRAVTHRADWRIFDALTGRYVELPADHPRLDEATARRYVAESRADRFTLCRVYVTEEATVVDVPRAPLRLAPENREPVTVVLDRWTYGQRIPCARCKTGTYGAETASQVCLDCGQAHRTVVDMRPVSR